VLSPLKQIFVPKLQTVNHLSELR